MHLLPFGIRIGGTQLFFQEDNVPRHTAKSTEEWFPQNGVPVIYWPPNSPDLNSIENLWGSLPQLCMHMVTKYDNVEQLKIAIANAWEAIDVDVLHNLVNIMCRHTEGCCQTWDIYWTLYYGGAIVMGHKFHLC